MVKRKNTKVANEEDKNSVDNNSTLLSYKLNIKCQNEKQKTFLKSLRDEQKEICFGVGSAGTGKTWLSLAIALQLIKNSTKSYKNIIIFIPCIESVSALKMGYLKGDLEEKTKCYKQNTYNTMIKILESSGNTNAKEIINYLISSGIIQFEFINFVKGKTFNNCICILEEAEDYSIDDMLLLLTRKGGKSCKMLISGDDKQISRNDIKTKKQITGLRFAANVLYDMKEVSVTEFTVEDIVRDKLLTEIIKRFEENTIMIRQ